MQTRVEVAENIGAIQQNNAEMQQNKAEMQQNFAAINAALQQLLANNN